MRVARTTFAARLRFALGATALAATVGCSSLPFGSKNQQPAAESEVSPQAEIVDGAPVNLANQINSQNVDRATANPFQMASAKEEDSNIFTSSWRKASDAISGAFSIKPKVNKAKDPLALSNSPKKLSPEVFLRAGRLLENRNHVPQAIRHYEKALELDEDNKTALTSLARLHDRQGDFAKAVPLYQRVIKLSPEEASTHNDLGLCHARQEDINSSLLSLNQAVRLDPKSALYRNNIATVLVEIDRSEEALKHLRSVNEESVAQYNLAYLLNRRNDVEKAIKHAQLAMQADPKLAAARQLHNQLSQRAGTSARRYHIGNTEQVETTSLRTSQVRRYATPDDDTPQPLPPVVDR